MNLLCTRLSVLVLAVMLLSCHSLLASNERGRQLSTPDGDKKVLIPGGNNLGAGTVPSKGGVNKAGQILMALHEEYRAYLKEAQAPGKEGLAFKSRNTEVRIIDGSVIIDAAASGLPEALAADLQSLGAQHITVFGRLVSCRLPISAIPTLNELSSLQFARPAYAMTNPGFVK